MKSPQIELIIKGSGLVVTDSNRTTVIIGGSFSGVEILINGKSKGGFAVSPKTSLVVVNGDKLKVSKKTHEEVVVKGNVEYFNPFSVNENNQLVLEPWVIEGNEEDPEIDYESDIDE